MLSFLIGVLTGVLTGILPSLHINTVAFLLAALNLQTNYLSFASFIVGLSVAHNFFDFIPAIIFGSGEEGAALSSFTGNKMFMQGRGLYALKLASLGALMGAVFFLILIPVLRLFLPIIFEVLSKTAWAGLLGISAYLILKDRSVKYALIIFLASGVLGLTVLKTNALAFPLLSLFSGLFGLGLLWENTSIKNVPAQASVLTYSEDEENFLVKIGVVNVADVFISLLTLFLIAKARSGALVELQKHGSLAFSDLAVLFAVGFTSAVVSFLLINFLGSKIIKLVTKLDYQKLTLACSGFILLINFLFNGFYGLVVCAAGAVISKKAVETKVMKSHCMGVLILPTLINYLLF